MCWKYSLSILLGWSVPHTRASLNAFLWRLETKQVSYIEIYMEKIRDLLDSYHTKVRLHCREIFTLLHTATGYFSSEWRYLLSIRVCGVEIARGGRVLRVILCPPGMKQGPPPQCVPPLLAPSDAERKLATTKRIEGCIVDASASSSLTSAPVYRTNSRLPSLNPTLTLPRPDEPPRAGRQAEGRLRGGGHRGVCHQRGRGEMR